MIVYGYRSLNALQLAEAARDLCEVIWLVDAGDAAAMALVPMLRRTGHTVEALGLSASAAAEALRALSPDGITTFYDTGMEHVAAIAAELGLPFNSVQTARGLEDKLHQREALRAGGLPTPAVALVPASGSEDELVAWAQQLTYPLVLKPRRASGSWHTFLIESPQELIERLAPIRANSSEELIVEGYLSDGPPLPAGFEADYVSVETVACAGELIHLCTTGRLPLVKPLRETGFFIPSTLDPETTQAVLDVATAALQALGFEFGCAHTEIKLTAEGPQVIEVNGRVGGGVPEMLKLSTGVEIIKLSMRAALRMELGVDPMPTADRVAFRFFYQPPESATRLLALDGLDGLAQREDVDDVFLHHNPGTELDATHGTRTYLFAVVGAGPDHGAVVAMRDLLERDISATYEHASASELSATTRSRSH